MYTVFFKAFNIHNPTAILALYCAVFTVVFTVVSVGSNPCSNSWKLKFYSRIFSFEYGINLGLGHITVKKLPLGQSDTSVSEFAIAINMVVRHKWQKKPMKVLSHSKKHSYWNFCKPCRCSGKKVSTWKKPVILAGFFTYTQTWKTTNKREIKNVSFMDNYEHMISPKTN